MRSLQTPSAVRVGLVPVGLWSSSIKVCLCLTCREATSPTTMELVESPSTATSLLMRTSHWSTPAKASCPWPTPGPTLTGPSSSSARSRRHGKNTHWRFTHRWEMKTMSFRHWNHFFKGRNQQLKENKSAVDQWLNLLLSSNHWTFDKYLKTKQRWRNVLMFNHLSGCLKAPWGEKLHEVVLNRVV